MRNQNGLTQSSIRVIGYLKNKIGIRGKTIFIACSPKSGSTFLMKLMCEVTGYSRSHLVFSYERSDPNIYYPALVDICNRKSIVQQHIRATNAHIELINKFKVTPIILTRNIYDVVVSLVDYFDSSNDPKMFLCYTAPQYNDLSRPEKISMMIELAVPWYFNFYAGWWDAIDQKQVHANWLTYESLTSDPEKIVSDILKFTEIKPKLSVKEAIDNVMSKRIRFNRGITGRGIIELTDDQQQSIKRLTRFYPWVDFSAMGL